MDVTILRVTSETAHLLDALPDDIFDSKISQVDLQRCLCDEHTILLLAIRQGLVVGQLLAFIHLHPDTAPDLYLDNLGVSRESQRRGIAKRLLNEAVVLAKQQGCRQAWVLTDQENAAAQALYASQAGAPTRALMYTLTLDV